MIDEEEQQPIDDEYEVGAGEPIEDDTEDDAYAEQAPEEGPAREEREAEPQPAFGGYPQPPQGYHTQNLREPLLNVLGEEGAAVTDAYIRGAIQERLEAQNAVYGNLARDQMQHPEWHRVYGGHLLQTMAMLDPAQQANPKSIEDARFLLMRMEIEQTGDPQAVYRRHTELLFGNQQPREPQQEQRQEATRAATRPAAQAPVARARQREQAPRQTAATARARGAGAGMVADLMQMYGISREEAERAFKTRRNL